jgi:hypothetical protein
VNRMALNFLNIQFQDSIIVKMGKLVGQLNDHFNGESTVCLVDSPLAASLWTIRVSILLAEGTRCCPSGRVTVFLL